MKQHLDIMLDGSSILDKVRSMQIERRRDQAVDILTLELADYSLYSSFDFGTLPASERLQVATAKGDPKTDGSTSGTAILTSASSGFVADGVTTDDLVMVLASGIPADVGTWKITAVAATQLTTNHTFGNASGVEFVVLKNQGKFFAEKPDIMEDLNRVSMPSLWGRSALARLTDPFAPKISRAWKTQTTFYAVVKELVKQQGMDETKVQFDIDDYTIPANLLSVTGQYPLQIIIDLATKTNGYVRSKKTGDLWIKKNLFHFDALSVALAVTDEEAREVTERVDYPDFGNRILIRSSIPSSGQDIQIQLRLETSCIRGDGIARTEAMAIVTDGDGKPAADGMPVAWTIDDTALAFFSGATTNTREKSIIGEIHRASGLRSVSASLPIRKIVGVFLETDLARADNYFDGGSFSRAQITLGKDLPFSDSKVLIDYVAAGIATSMLISKENAPETETEVHAAIGKIRDSQQFCVSNRRNVAFSLSADPTEHNICVEYDRVSEIVAAVRVDGNPGSGAMVQFLVEGAGSVSPAFAAVKNQTINGETVRPVEIWKVAVRHQIAGVTGVWVLPDGKSSTNYYSTPTDRAPSFSGNEITLGTDLPGTGVQVIVEYSAQSIARAVYSARSSIGQDKVIARINDGTSQKHQDEILIETVNRCGEFLPSQDPPGGKKDCSQSTPTAKLCQGESGQSAKVECICKAEGQSSGCPTTEAACRSFCEDLYAKYGLDPLNCETVVPAAKISKMQTTYKKIITQTQAKSYESCEGECDGNPQCVEECVKAHRDAAIERCAQTCEDHVLSINPTTAQMPCGEASPSISFTVKGTGPFFWSSTAGILIVAADGKSAALKHDNPGGAVAGIAYTQYGWKSSQTCDCNGVGGSTQSGVDRGCSDNQMGSSDSGGCPSSDMCAPGGCSCPGNPPATGGPHVCSAGNNCGAPQFGGTAAVFLMASPGRGFICDRRTESMKSLGCRPCVLQFSGGTAKVRVTDGIGQSVEAAVTL